MKCSGRIGVLLVSLLQSPFGQSRMDGCPSNHVQLGFAEFIERATIAQSLFKSPIQTLSSLESPELRSLMNRSGVTGFSRSPPCLE